MKYTNQFIKENKIKFIQNFRRNIIYYLKQKCAGSIVRGQSFYEIQLAADIKAKRKTTPTTIETIIEVIEKKQNISENDIFILLEQSQHFINIANPEVFCRAFCQCKNTQLLLKAEITKFLSSDCELLLGKKLYYKKDNENNDILIALPIEDITLIKSLESLSENKDYYLDKITRYFAVNANAEVKSEIVSALATEVYENKIKIENLNGKQINLKGDFKSILENFGFRHKDKDKQIKLNTAEQVIWSDWILRSSIAYLILADKLKNKE